MKPMFVNTIPAAPGFCVLEVLHGDDGPVEPVHNPVVAWALEEGTLAPYPITLEGVQTDNVWILHPSGQVERPCAQYYASVEEWFKGEQEAVAESRQAAK